MSFFRFCLFSLITYCSSDDILVGGFTEEDVNDPYVKEFAQKAIPVINKQSNATYHQVLIKVLSARSQVVAGTKYEIILLVGETECKYNVLPGQVGDCVENPSKVHKRQVYTITVWSKPWENFEEIKIKDVKNYTS